ncbi:hypothetical protein JHK86_023205 [Glycine max]|nr:hypothetical protein JHK86_023205 [Glycine max]
MTSSVILRRSSSVIPRCFFAALASVEPLPRRFPADRPLNFCTSVVPRAVQFTVERDYSNYEEVSGANSDEGLEIMNLRIAPQIVDALAKKGVVKLFPIQRAELEPARQGRDMIGRARTGTGKTLALGYPSWTVSFSLMLSMVDTPGRIIDLLNRGALNLKNVKFVVLDEADQMLQVGFQEAVEKILEGLSPNRQTLMFSATMPSWIKNISRNYLNNPLTIDLSSMTLAKESFVDKLEEMKQKLKIWVPSNNTL